MILGRLRARAAREWVYLLLLPALAFRLFVPAGFMPTVGDDLAVTMQMCHGDAKSSIVVRLAGADDAPAAPDANHEAPCVGGAMVSGFEQTTRVNEPGRTLWLKVAGRFD
jgi:hypothetical protein